MDAKATHRALALAAGAVVSVLSLTGCEKLQQSTAEADRAAVQQMSKEQLEAAASEKGASATLRAAANARLATQRYQQASEAYAQTLERKLEVMRLGWRAAHFAIIAGENMEASRAISKYEPAANLEKLDQVIGDIRGASDKMTRTLESAQGLELATITSMQATIEKLNHDIADGEKEIASLETQRQQLAQQSQTLANQSNDAKGQQSVDLFRQSAEAKKAAADTATKIESAQLRLIPLRQSLAAAEVQKESLTASLGQMDALKTQVSAGWDDIRQQSTQRMKNAESMAGKQPAQGQATLLNAVKEMETLSHELEQAYQKATGGYANAAASDAAALAAAQDAYKRAGELATLYKGKPEEKIFKSIQTLVNTSGARMNQVSDEYATARTYADWAAVLQARQDAITALQEIAQQVKLPVPSEMNARQLSGQGAEVAAKATEQLKKSAADFDAIAAGPMASPETKRAATVGRIATQLALAEMADRAGQAANAKGYRETAKTAANDLKSSTPPEAQSQLPAIVQEAAAGL